MSWLALESDASAAAATCCQFGWVFSAEPPRIKNQPPTVTAAISVKAPSTAEMPFGLPAPVRVASSGRTECLRFWHRGQLDVIVCAIVSLSVWLT